MKHLIFNFFLVTKLILESHWLMIQALAKILWSIPSMSRSKLNEGVHDLPRAVQHIWKNLSYGRVISQFKTLSERQIQKGLYQIIYIRNKDSLNFRWSCFVDVSQRGIALTQNVVMKTLRSLPFFSYFIGDLFSDVFIPWPSVLSYQFNQNAAALCVNEKGDTFHFYGPTAKSIMHILKSTYTKSPPSDGDFVSS